MTSSNEIMAIQNRKKGIAEEIARLKEEDNELDVALRVLARLGGHSSDSAHKPEISAEESTKTSGDSVVATRLGPPRPSGTPSLYEMTVDVLREAIAAGKPGLRGKEIVAEIGRKYWPGLQPEQVLPPIYSFVGKKRLRKNSDGIFKPID